MNVTVKMYKMSFTLTFILQNVVDLNIYYFILLQIPERGSKLYEACCKFLVTFDAMSDGDRQQLEEKVKEVLMKKTKEDHCCVKVIIPMTFDTNGLFMIFFL